MTERRDDKNSQRKSSDSRESRRVRATNNCLKDNKISWSAIIAGAISFSAVFIVLSLLVWALGFGIFSPNNQNSLSSTGIGVAIATVIILLISFIVSGFITGAFSKGQPLLHGFMSWALSIILLFSLITTIIVQALGLAEQPVQTVADSVISTAGDARGNVLSSVADSISGVDTKELEENIKNTFSKTDIAELQPEFITKNLNEVKAEISNAGKELLTNPENKDKILKDLSDSLEKRATDITNSINKETIQEEVYKNSNLTAQKSQEAVDNIFNGLETASKEASKQITNAKEALNQTNKEADKTIKDVKNGTESTTNKASFATALIILFLIIGLGIEIYVTRLGEEYMIKY
ncbi:hypothetical protein HV819_08405 [Anaerococcus sp. AGMB00486]|uniref:Uncharacterized protein n=1 Tax=Anaerococcus faecalis TaxID=2742993 RepID=A0ABX2NBS1_9FIRM|nr:TIGR04086 family membrane protein [Anaerococcus faecalis]NVF11999.1 hypothetical protein [Anaerococcus faecalis]